MKRILNKLFYEAGSSSGINDSFFKKNDSFLKKANLSIPQFIDKYNDHICEELIIINKKLDEMSSDLQQAEGDIIDAWMPFRFNYVLSLVYQPSKANLEQIVDAFEKLLTKYNYLHFVFTHIPVDGPYANSIQRYIICDTKLSNVKMYYKNETPYVPGYICDSTTRFTGLIVYLYEQGYKELFNKMVEIVSQMIKMIGSKMVFVIISLLNFLKHIKSPLFKDVFDSYLFVKRYDFINWEDSLKYLCEFERNLLKDDVKDLTIEKALNI